MHFLKKVPSYAEKVERVKSRSIVNTFPCFENEFLKQFSYIYLRQYKFILFSFSLQSLNTTRQGFNIFTELRKLVLFKEKEI